MVKKQLGGFGLKNSFIASKYYSMLVSGTLMMLLVSVMSVIDTLIAGVLNGEYMVDGICLVLPIYSFASFISVFFSYGTAILYAEKNGAFKSEDANRIFGVGLTMIFMMGVIMFLAVSAGGDAYLKMYAANEQIYSYAKDYLSWMKYVVLILPLNELLDGMLFADGDEKIALWGNVVQGVLKLSVSYVLCGVMGVKGLAIGSVISLVAAISVLCIHFFTPGNTMRPHIAFSFKIALDILKFGIVDGSTHLFVSLFLIILNFFVIKRFGIEMLIMVSVITLLKESQIIFEGIGEAITPLISTYLGEENYPGIKAVWRLAFKSLLIESVFFTLFFIAFAHYVPGILGIRDAAAANYAIWGLRILSLTLLFTCWLFLDSSYFILVDKIPLGIFGSFLRDLFPAVPFALLGGIFFGVYGMFIGLMAAQPVGYLISVFYIKKKYGKENYPLFIADKERNRNQRLFEFAVLPDKIVSVRDEIGEALNEFCDTNQINRVMVIFEELFMLIYDKNKGRNVRAECMVEIGDTVRLITKDDGQIVDLTNSDLNVTSLRSYTLSNLLCAHTVKRIHHLVLSYNRNMIEVKASKKDDVKKR